MGVRDVGSLCAHLLGSSAAVNTTLHVTSDRLVVDGNAGVDPGATDWESKLTDALLTPDAGGASLDGSP